MAQQGRPSVKVKQGEKPVRIYFDGLQYTSQLMQWKYDNKLDVNEALLKFWQSLPEDVQNNATAKYDDGTTVKALEVIDKGNFDPKFFDLKPEPITIQVPLRNEE